MNISLHKTIHNVPQSAINSTIQFVLFENPRKSEWNWFFPSLLLPFFAQAELLLIFLKLPTTCKTSGSVISANVPSIWASLTGSHTQHNVHDAIRRRAEEKSQFNFLMLASVVERNVLPSEAPQYLFSSLFHEVVPLAERLRQNVLENHFRNRLKQNLLHDFHRHGEARMHSLWAHDVFRITFMWVWCSIRCESGTCNQSN